jgi:hypothetical protein
MKFIIFLIVSVGISTLISVFIALPLGYLSAALCGYLGYKYRDFLDG